MNADSAHGKNISALSAKIRIQLELVLSCGSVLAEQLLIVAHGMLKEEQGGVFKAG